MKSPTYADAYQFARVLAQAGDRAGADALMCRLLWHVRAENGGFIGLDDKKLVQKVRQDPRLNLRDVDRFRWEPGDWPSQSYLTLPVRTEAEARATKNDGGNHERVA